MSRFALFLPIAILIYFVAAFLLFVFQKRLIYYPTPEVEHGLFTFNFENDGCKLNVIAVNNELESDKAIVYFGGNGESVAYTAMQFATVYDNIPMYFLNYRGYGKSSCSAEEKAIYSDALKLFDLISENYADVTVLGRSLGSGVATYVAANRKTSAVILVTPYDSIEKIAQATMPFLPVSLLLNQKYLSIDNAANIDEKVLALIAANDKTIARKNSDRLVAAFKPEQIETVVFERLGHNDISNNPDYFQIIADFVLKPEASKKIDQLIKSHKGLELLSNYLPPRLANVDNADLGLPVTMLPSKD